MSDIAIRCEGLSKQYRIGKRERYRALRDVLTDAMSAPFRGLRSSIRNSKSEIRNGSSSPSLTPNPEPRTLNSDSFWALDDVSFEVRHGEVVGIIGRNGAGKSTLLKILSRITEPTRGFAEINGRVGSLLEVGTGFHPELTGRENIYLNGAILGMKRAEIERRFDEIVAFAETEKFLDTPVKYYSSGMQMRLAFAVAAHLDPEILLVDEVLAVGDAQFQKKCLEKMKEVGRGGRTILFVSHNMSAIRNICHRGLVLESGLLTDDDCINSAVDNYLTRVVQAQIDYNGAETQSFIVNKVEIRSASGPVIKTFDPVEIRIGFTAKVDVIDPGVYISLLTLDNHRLTALDFKDFQTVSRVAAGDQIELGFSVEALPILPGSYQLEVYLKDMASHKIELVPCTFPFEIVESAIYGGRKIDGWYGRIGLKARAHS